MQESKMFNDYMQRFKMLPLHEKQNQVEQQVKELLAIIEKLKSDLKIKDKILFNKEILDLKKENSTPDDFAEAMFVYVTMIRESFASYADYVTNIIYEEE